MRTETKPERIDTSERDSRLAAELARAWVDQLTAQLEGDGRPLEGGWPGTISEARRLVTHRLASPSLDVSRPRFERIVKAMYSDAKNQWLAHANRRPCPSVED